MAPAIGITQLRNELSALVARAAAGEYLLITVRGQPVAELVPPDRTRQAIRAMVESGKVEWGGFAFNLDDPPLDLDVDLSSAVLEDRR